MKSAGSISVRFLIVAAVAAAVGFAFHVADQSVVPAWVQHRMRGVPSAGPPGGSTIVFAALSSIEIGIALVILYAVLRRATPGLNIAIRGLLLGVLSLAVHGELIRQAFMNLIIGNPIDVALAMAAGPWITSIAMGLVAAFTYEWLIVNRSGAVF